jgi:hypothetical protein
MAIVDLIIWILAAYGMSTILVYGSIFRKPRTWIISNSKFFGELIQCILCTSMWVGVFLSLIMGSISRHYFEFEPLNLVVDGCITAGGVWALNAIIEWFEENRPNKPNVL